MSCLYCTDVNLPQSYRISVALHAPRCSPLARCVPQARTAPTCGGSVKTTPRQARCCWNTWARTRQWSSGRRAARRGSCRACGTTSSRGTSGRRRPSGDRTGSAASHRACPSWCAACRRAHGCKQRGTCATKLRPRRTALGGATTWHYACSLTCAAAAECWERHVQFPTQA